MVEILRYTPKGMMNKEKYLIFCLLLFLNTSFIPFVADGQNWEGDNSLKTSNEWIFNANVGVLSYFGDLSIYDNDIAGKLESESGRAGGIMVTKKVNKAFGLSAQLLTGKLKASKGNISFETTLYEYNVSAYIDLISLLKIQKLKNLEIQVFGGMGNMIFNASKFEFYEGETKQTDHKTRVPEFVYFAGMGVHYRFSSSFGVNTSLSLRQCQNDKLDVYYKLPDFDYYTYFQFGFTYHLKPMFRNYVNNRARIAHNNIRLKPLK
jgi:hypothetical protein